MVNKLLAFKVSISNGGHDSNGNDWRENPHDDLVLALAVGVWWGENGSKPVLLRKPVKGLWPPSGRDQD